MAPAVLRNFERCAIFLDVDGTLIDIAPTPDSVVVPEDLVATLARLSRALGGAVAIVTGRPAAEVDRFLTPLRPLVAGVHGAEMRVALDGEIEEMADALDPSVIAAVSKLADIHPGVIVEPKGASIAVHYRLAGAVGPAIETELRRILAATPDHAELCPGRKVVEIVPRHISKGGALKAFMNLPAFRGRRPIMIGDDVSDQSAFAAAQELGGQGLRVAGEYFRREDADFESPSRVRAWLSTLAQGLGK